MSKIASAAPCDLTLDLAPQGRTRLQFLRRLRLPDSELGPFWSAIVFAGGSRSAAEGQPVGRTPGTVWHRLKAATWLAVAGAP